MRSEDFRISAGRAAEQKCDHRHGRCCARAASGHATAVPPSSVMNSRRFFDRIASDPPPAGTAHGSISNWLGLVRGIRPILRPVGCWLASPMSALGQERTSLYHLATSGLPLKADKASTCWHVRFVPKADKAHRTLWRYGRPLRLDQDLPGARRHHAARRSRRTPAPWRKTLPGSATTCARSATR